MRTISFFLILFFSFISFNLFSQNSTEADYKPLWLRMDEAIQLVESGEIGEAVYAFRKILEDVPGNPESEMWLGLIFDKENEYDLAISHLELALEHKKQLVILEDLYRILYRLADIHLKVGDSSAYKDNLSSVIEFSGEQIQNNNLKTAMFKVLTERGYDKYIELYRPHKRISLKAYSLLGKYYFEKENWTLAAEYLMEATGSIISSSIEEIKRIDPDYNFLIDESTDKSLENVFDLVNNVPLLKEYFKTNSFYEYFYYLG
ncbi:MAG: hypothetical protein KAR21_11550, partial [Spirochaetales bacterium]|nr:hypothetical protein [Spirochaetales bacterium]